MPRGAPANRPLTARLQRFVAGYVLHGNGAKAAVDAGVPPAGAKVWASRTLKKLTIQAAIANQRATFANPLVNPEHVDVSKIADATERRERLSAMLRDKDMHPLARLKAVDVLNRMDGLYLQKHEHTLRTSLLDLLAPGPSA